MDKGSTINLTCTIRFGPEPPGYIFWYHENKVSTFYIYYFHILFSEDGCFFSLWRFATAEIVIHSDLEIAFIWLNAFECSVVQLSCFPVYDEHVRDGGHGRSCSNKRNNNIAIVKILSFRFLVHCT